MRFLFECQWCFKSHLSHYRGEAICQKCDSELIDQQHLTFETVEVEELLLNGYTIENIQKLISNDITYRDALKTLINEGDRLLEDFLR